MPTDAEILQSQIDSYGVTRGTAPRLAANTTYRIDKKLTLGHAKRLSGVGRERSKLTVQSSLVGNVIENGPAVNGRSPQSQVLSDFGIQGPDRDVLGYFAESGNPNLPYLRTGVRHTGCGNVFKNLRVVDLQGTAYHITKAAPAGFGILDYEDNSAMTLRNLTSARVLTGLKIDSGADARILGTNEFASSRDYGVWIGPETSSFKGANLHAWGAGICPVYIAGNGHSFDWLHGDAGVGVGVEFAATNSHVDDLLSQFWGTVGALLSGENNTYSNVHVFRPRESPYNPSCGLKVTGTRNRVQGGFLDIGVTDAYAFSVEADHTVLRDVTCACQSNVKSGGRLGTPQTPLNYSYIEVELPNWRNGGSAVPGVELYLGVKNTVIIKHHGWATPYVGTNPDGSNGNVVKFVSF